MKLNLEINNLAKSPIKEAVIKTVAKKTLQADEFNFLKNKTILISLAIVGKAEIKKINKIYRKKNEPTDVLSFAEYKNIRGIEAEKGRRVFLGELILCYDDIKDYANREETDFDKELAKAVVHGILHLFGLAHGKKTFGIQDKVIK